MHQTYGEFAQEGFIQATFATAEVAFCFWIAPGLNPGAILL